MAIFSPPCFLFGFALLASLANARPRLPFAPRQNSLQNTSSSNADAAAAAACDPAWLASALSSLSIPHTTLTPHAKFPRTVAARGSFGSNDDDPENGQFQTAVPNLPALCAIKFHVDVEAFDDNPVSSYDVGMFLPTTWKDGLLTVGGESFGGGINWPAMGQGVQYGFATVSTNNGHDSAGGATVWAKDNDGMKQDWGFRAIHGSVVLGKELVKSFYGNKPFKSYYSGCSTGGRQGLREIADHADSFDGLLIGAPAWDTVAIGPWVSYLSRKLADHGGAFSQAEIDIISAQVRIQCDLQGTDKVNDTIASDPAACYKNFDWNKLLCSSTLTTNCIERERGLNVLPAFYEPYIVPPEIATPGLVSPGYDMGSEWGWTIYQKFVTGGDLLNGFNMDYERNFLGQADADVRNYSNETVAAARKEGAGKAPAPPVNLDAFRKLGGKIIMYHGMADGLLPRGNTERWYNDAMSLNPDGDNFLRYFEVPAMGHCRFSAIDHPFAPWIFGAPGQGSAPTTGDRDALQALVDWVTVKGNTGPRQFIATSVYTDTRVPPAHKWTRPICAYPQRANMTGTDFTEKGSWVCAGP